MQVPESAVPQAESDSDGAGSSFIIPTSAGYETDWRVLFAFHQAASRDFYRSRRRRAWHADQARIIRLKHPLEAAVGYCWSEQCRQAREAYQ